MIAGRQQVGDVVFVEMPPLGVPAKLAPVQIKNIFIVRCDPQSRPRHGRVIGNFKRLPEADRLSVKGVRLPNPRTHVAEIMRTPFGQRIFNRFRRIIHIRVFEHSRRRGQNGRRLAPNRRQTEEQGECRCNRTRHFEEGRRALAPGLF